MGKPSIFSSNYDKIMKRRKRRVRIGILICILLSLGIIYVVSTDFKLYFDKFKQEKQNVVVDEGKNKEDSGEDENKDVEKESKSLEIKINSGAIVNAEYEENDGERKFTFVKGLPDGSTFDINKSQNLILINDGKTQEIKTYDLEGNEKNVTKKNYVTRSGKTFDKDTILKGYKGYKWSVNARFLDDSHIVYVSQLPWFGTSKQNVYAWIIDLKTGNHITSWESVGNDIKFGKTNKKGIEIIIDGKTKTLTKQGNCL